MFRKLTSVLAWQLVLTVWVSARIINIPDDYSTIQNGIDVSWNNDTVLVAPGLYAENIDFHNHRITLASHYILDQDPATIAGTIIDGNGLNSVIKVNSSGDTFSSIEGFTLQNGASAYYGGGIYCQAGSITIRNNVIWYNRSVWDGGGIYCSNGIPKIENNIIAYNRSTAMNGGGIALYTSTSNVRNNVIYGNRAYK